MAVSFLQAKTNASEAGDAFRYSSKNCCNDSPIGISRMLLFDFGDETFPSALSLSLRISSVIFLSGDALVWLSFRTHPRRVQGTNTAEL